MGTEEGSEFQGRVSQVFFIASYKDMCRGDHSVANW